MPSREPTLEDLARMLGITPASLSRIVSRSNQSRSGFFSKLGRILDGIFGGGRSAASQREIDSLPPELGEILGGNSPAAGNGRSTAAPPRPTPGGIPPDPPPSGFPSSSPPGGRRSPRVSGMNQEPPTEQELENEWSGEFLAPHSSNVYSFQMHRRARDTTGTLYVTFRAAKINSKAVSTGTTRKGRSTSRSQLIGKAGKTVGGGDKPFAPGARYAYLRVSANIFQRMKDSVSKGKFVWDYLRVRGTVWGHKYEYQLVQGQVVPGLGGAYVPRKATAKGFRTRSVADVGSGRRGFVTSTLPPTSAAGGGGFRTRSVAARSTRR